MVLCFSRVSLNSDRTAALLRARIRLSLGEKTQRLFEDCIRLARRFVLAPQLTILRFGITARGIRRLRQASLLPPAVNVFVEPPSFALAFDTFVSLAKINASLLNSSLYFVDIDLISTS
jgi:hypothetical protein